MFRKFYFSALIVTALTTPYSASYAQSIEAFDMQRCVNMGNSLEAPRDAPWGKPINVDHFKMIAQKGFDTVRIPVRWSDYTDDNANYRIEDDFLNDVERIVDAALSEDLNVILNIHHFEEIFEDPKSQTGKLLAIWEQVGERFKDKSDSLWFEVLNEPHDQLKGKALAKLQQKAVKAIRSSNPNRLVILGGENWSGIDSLPTNIALPDANIVYTFHYYDPFDFTHQKAEWLSEHMPEGTRGWGDEDDVEDLAAAAKTASAFRSTIKRPVFLGEFGAYDKVEPAERVQYAGAVREAMEGAQIPWCLWSFSNTFALYDHETAAWDEAMLRALIPDTEVLGTKVVSANNATIGNENWGRFLNYYSGQTDHIKDVLTGVAEIKPGMEIHPPHKHVEEEFLMVLDGEGTWTVGDEDFPARAGDILYAAPWDLHGIRNSGDTTLKFVVFKYNRK